MEYHNLGSSGLKVSTLSCGTMDITDTSKVDEYFEIISEAIKSGINCFETAEVYGLKSVGQEIFGSILKKLAVPREEIVIKLKLFFGDGIGQGDYLNTIGLSRKRVIEGTNNSLTRLGLDYVDVIYLQKYDYDTDLVETCKAMHYLIEKGFFILFFFFVIYFFLQTKTDKPKNIFLL
jgi:aryl-alcohol dehydrogenase-like predicted oxidoreductase